jgi:hypothetical protein
LRSRDPASVFLDAKPEQESTRPVNVAGAGRFPHTLDSWGLGMKRAFTIIVAFIGAIGATSGAGDVARGGSLLVFGAGAVSCGAWLRHAETDDADHVVMASWMDGYLTAANQKLNEDGQTASLGQNTQGTGRDAWITRYCQANPQDALFRAASALVLDLAKR